MYTSCLLAVIVDKKLPYDQTLIVMHTCKYVLLCTSLHTCDVEYHCCLGFWHHFVLFRVVFWDIIIGDDGGSTHL
jgi:hypothetical protein